MSATTTTLTAADLALHSALGIGAELLKAAQVRRVDDLEGRAIVAQPKWHGNLGGIVYPYVHPKTGHIRSYRLRRDHPEIEGGKPSAKYLTAAGDRSYLYFAPDAADWLDDPTVPVIVVEAEKSVLAITAAAIQLGRGVLAIGLGGCWGWKGRIGKVENAAGVRVDEKGPLPDWDLITWAERPTVLVFDANVATNPKVQQARHALARELRPRGARTRVMNLPPEPGINGPDDYIGRYGARAFFSRLDRAQLGSRAASGTPGANHIRHLTLTPASAITPRPVRWLWEDRLALGTFALLGGREGLGKSILADTLAADITRGRLPGQYFGEPRAVIVAATEDSWEFTIVPRLTAAGADLTRVFRVDVTCVDLASGGESTTTLLLPTDVAELERVVREKGAALVIFDPLLSRLDDGLDSHKDAEVRQGLEPVVRVADGTGACVVGLVHVNKSNSTDPLTLLMGSRAFVAVARAVLFVMLDPDDETQAPRLLGQPKNNLGRVDLPTLTFHIAEVKVADTAEGEVRTGRLEWTGETDRTIRDAIEAAAAAAGDRSATSEAADWLFDFLIGAKDGRAKSADIKRKGPKAGHSVAALKRAAGKLHLTFQSQGFPRETWWALSSRSTAQSAQSGRREPTEPTGPTEPTEPADVVQSAQWAQSAQSAQVSKDEPTGPSPSRPLDAPVYPTTRSAHPNRTGRSEDDDGDLV